MKTRARGFYNTLIAALSRVPHKADILLIIAAIAYSLPSIGYPFGRDQAAHFYVGREWLNGLLPYRDIFDHKPPGIHLVHAASILLLGAHQWSIRAAELAGMVLIGITASRAVRRSRPCGCGESGVLVLLTASFYFTCFDYWDTAQVETWEGLALVASYAAAENEQTWWRRAVLSGCLAGAAFLFKFPSAIISLLIAGVVALRSRDDAGELHWLRMPSALALFAGSFAAVSGACAGYFILRGGWSEMLDMLYGFNRYYVLQKPTDAAVALAWASNFWITNCSPWVCVVLVLWFAGIVFAVKGRYWPIARGAAMAMLLCVSAAASVAVQQKFYSYHWGVMVPFMMACAGYGVAVCMRYLPRITIVTALAIVLIGFFSAPPWCVNNNTNYLKATVSFWLYNAGYMERANYLKPFIGGFGYNYRDNELIGEMIKKRARPGDQLHVRGFEPAIYAVSGLRSPSRFFHEIPFIDTKLQYRHGEWLHEHQRALLTCPPRFIVTFSHDTYDLRSLLKRGYLKIASAGRFVLLESGRWLDEE